MSFGDVAASAVRFAAEGFAVNALLAQSIRAHEADWTALAAERGDLPPPGAANRRQLGDRFVQTDSAKTIAYMVDQRKEAANQRSRPCGRAGGGPRRLLSGRHRAGDRRVSPTRGRPALGRGPCGLPSPAVQPAVRRFWRGHEVMVCGPWCQGPALRRKPCCWSSRSGWTGLSHTPAPYLHVLVECSESPFPTASSFSAIRSSSMCRSIILLAPETSRAAPLAVDTRCACPEMPPPLDLAGRRASRGHPQRPCREWRPTHHMPVQSIAGATRSAPHHRMGIPGPRR